MFTPLHLVVCAAGGNRNATASVFGGQGCSSGGAGGLGLSSSGGVVDFEVASTGRYYIYDCTNVKTSKYKY